MQGSGGKYNDIINMERPKSKRPKMDLLNRAKIFAPFAALRGHEELLGESAKKNAQYDEIERIAEPVCDYTDYIE